MTKNSLKVFDAIPLSPQRFRHIGNHVIDLVGQALALAADQKGRALSKEEIDLVLEAFRETPQGLWQYYRHAFERFIAATENQQLVSYERRNMLLRMVVGTFEHLLINETAEGETQGTISRKIIGPIERTLEVMLGKDILESGQEACRLIVNDLENTLGDAFTWQPFYDDPRTNEVLLDVCAGLARHFDDFEARMKWFINVLNRHAHLSGPGAASGDDSEEFGERDFILVMTCLMGRAEQLLDQGGAGAGFEHGLSDQDADRIRALCARLRDLSAD